MSDPRVLAAYAPGRIVVMPLDQGKSRPWLILQSRLNSEGGRVLMLNGLTTRGGYAKTAFNGEEIIIPQRPHRPTTFISGMYRVICIGGAYGLPHLDPDAVDETYVHLALARLRDFIGEYNHE